MSVRWLVPFVLIAMAGCRPYGPSETVRGPEASRLAGQVHAVVVVPSEAGHLIATLLPSGQRYTVRRRGAQDPSVYAMSGPDNEGRLVVVNHCSNDTHDLEVLTLWGDSLRTVFARSGDAMWDNVIGESLALAPRGGRVALISALRPRQMPDALLEEGALELWNVGDGTGGRTPVVALDQGLQWLPDGRRLLFVGLVPAAEVRGLPMAADGFGKGFGTWPSVPVVHLLDVLSGRARRLHVGWRPVASDSGEACLVSDSGVGLRRVDLATGRSEPQPIPGPSSWPLAWLANGLLVYNGRPTAGAKVGYTRYYSPLVGPQWNRVLKVADLKTGEFQTLLSDIDPRDRPSVGCPLAPR